jgi:hypothetical protein
MTSPTRPSPVGRVTRADVEAALGDVQTDLVTTVESRRRSLTVVGIGVGVLVVVVAYLFGRRSARRLAGIVEVRRR